MAAHALVPAVPAPPRLHHGSRRSPASPQKGLRPAFVFAHADDAVFSSFFALIETGPQALDLVICAGLPMNDQAGPWDKLCGFTSSADARRCRLAEHKCVGRFVGIHSIALDELDGQYGDALPRAAGTTAESIVKAMRSARTNIVLTHGWSSDHPDHRRIVALAQSAGEILALPVVFTCDRPYSSCSAQTCEFLGKPPRGRRMSIALPDDIWELKMRAVRLYASQSFALRGAFGPHWCTRPSLGRECHLFISK